MNNDIEKELKKLQKEYNKVLKENNKLKRIIKDNFDYYDFKGNKTVFFVYNLPVMDKEILEVLENK